MTFPQAPVSPGPSEGARIWAVDVSTVLDSPTDSDWHTVHGMFGFQPNRTNTTADGSTFDDGSLQVDETVGFKLDLALNLRAKTYSGAEDAGQAIIREAAESFEIPMPQVLVRWYKRNGSGDANVARAQAEWADQGGGPTDLRTVNATLHVQTLPTTGANPATSLSKPLIVSVLPATAAAGELVTITGQFFSDVTGAAGVKFGATNAADYEVVSSSKIVASLPAGSAGPANVLVTNGAGASVAFPYTRGA